MIFNNSRLSFQSNYFVFCKLAQAGSFYNINVNQINKTFPFITSKQSIILLRIAVALFLMAHGIYLGTVGGFGEFLDSNGFFIGVPLAWGITVFEIAGGAAMAWGVVCKLDCCRIYDRTNDRNISRSPSQWMVCRRRKSGRYGVQRFVIVYFASNLSSSLR